MSSNLFKIQLGKERLWKGCILASIAHAIMVAHYPEISNEQSWDGFNYSVQNSGESRGTISFSGDWYVGAFRNDDSQRLKKENKLIEYKSYFCGAPSNIIELAEKEALQYLLQKVDEDIVPLITTAIWGNEIEAYSNDTFKDMQNNGAFLLERQMMDECVAFDSWKEYYDMTKQQCDLLKNIYNKKIQHPNNLLILSKEEINMVEADNEEGLNESKISFSEIGIKWGE